jgi:hypothetical protein
MRVEELAACMGDRRDAYRVAMWKTEGKRQPENVTADENLVE